MTTLQTIKSIEADLRISHNISVTADICKFQVAVDGAWRPVWVTATTVTVGGIGQLAGSVQDALRRLFRDEWQTLQAWRVA